MLADQSVDETGNMARPILELVYLRDTDLASQLIPAPRAACHVKFRVSTLQSTGCTRPFLGRSDSGLPALPVRFYDAAASNGRGNGCTADCRSRAFPPADSESRAIPRSFAR